MPVDILSPDTGDQQFNQNRTIPRQRFNHSASVAGEGKWLILPPGIGEFLVSVEPSSGTARVEYTQDSVEEVTGGTAVGHGWAEGDVTEYADSLMVNAVTAIRCVSTVSAGFKVTA
ncbi:hypothetical protein [uncultured Marinobacter sp.]|uniref:hypothetical protein n=1 Tax=uncultured Marinobacter sp. TaxID=187379 RepID=UPI0030DAD090|tara:strand:+ start:977 stop:1324 length:348 start_codon:yes stop_codon:yes gene_type:complete